MVRCVQRWLPAVLLSTVLTCAEAAPIAIVNPSFEDDSTDTGTHNMIPTTGWTHSVPVSTTFQMGTYNVTSGGSFANIPHGTGTVWMNATGSMSQVLPTTLAGGGNYNLSAYVGLRSNNVIAGHLYALQLWAGGVFLNEVSGETTLADQGTFRQISLTYQAPAVVAPGQNLEIRLVHRSASSFYPQLAWDLVALDGPIDEPAVPEPASMTITAMGLLLGLTWRRSRRMR